MAQAKRKPDEENDGYVPFRERFSQWWNGEDEPPDRKVRVVKRGEASGPDVIQVDEPIEPGDAPRWTDARVGFCTRLWGGGELDQAVEPGGSAYVASLLKTAAITPQKSAIDLSAGLGGGVRQLANTMGLWIPGMEPDAELAKRGHAISVKSGLAKKAPISAYAPSTLELPESKYHAILLRDRLYRMDSRPEVLAKIRAALKPGGYFILTDFALPDDARREEATLTEWRELDPETPALWTASGYRAALKKLGYELRAFETDSQTYRDMVIESWTRFVDGLAQPELTDAFVDTMMREAEIWLRLDRALQSGSLVHLHALARVPEQGPAQ